MESRKIISEWKLATTWKIYKYIAVEGHYIDILLRTSSQYASQNRKKKIRKTNIWPGLLPSYFCMGYLIAYRVERTAGKGKISQEKNSHKAQQTS